MKPNRRALLRSFLAIPFAARLAPVAAPAVATFRSTQTMFATAVSNLKRGDAVFIMSDGTVRSFTYPLLTIVEGVVHVEPGDSLVPFGRVDGCGWRR